MRRNNIKHDEQCNFGVPLAILFEICAVVPIWNMRKPDWEIRLPHCALTLCTYCEMLMRALIYITNEIKPLNYGP